MTSVAHHVGAIVRDTLAALRSVAGVWILTASAVAVWGASRVTEIRPGPMFIGLMVGAACYLTLRAYQNAEAVDVVDHEIVDSVDAEPSSVRSRAVEFIMTALGSIGVGYGALWTMQALINVGFDQEAVKYGFAITAVIALGYVLLHALLGLVDVLADGATAASRRWSG